MRWRPISILLTVWLLGWGLLWGSSFVVEARVTVHWAYLAYSVSTYGGSLVVKSERKLLSAPSGVGVKKLPSCISVAEGLRRAVVMEQTYAPAAGVSRLAVPMLYVMVIGALPLLPVSGKPRRKGKGVGPGAGVGGVDADIHERN